MIQNIFSCSLVALMFVALHAYVYRTKQTNRMVDMLNAQPRYKRIARRTIGAHD
jgi:hypothetical protein